MAFLKHGTAPVDPKPTSLEDFSKQATETCQSCGYKMSPDEAGSLVCRTAGCAKADST